MAVGRSSGWNLEEGVKESGVQKRERAEFCQASGADLHPLSFAPLLNTVSIFAL
jgi:hypothetical protein